MGKLDEMFERIERYGIYVVLVVLIIGQTVSSLVPAIGMQLDTGAGFTSLALVLLLLFRYLDRNFKNIAMRGLAQSDSLPDAITHTVKGRSDYDHADILAHTSNVYYQGIRQNNVMTKHLRLLLRKMDNVDDMFLPENKSGRESIKNRQQTQLEEWQALQHAGRIGRLEVAFYPFEPMVHMMIVDGERAVFGLNGLERQFPGVSSATHHPFTLSESTEDTRQFIHNLEATFKQIWDEFNVGEGEDGYGERVVFGAGAGGLE